MDEPIQPKKPRRLRTAQKVFVKKLVQDPLKPAGQAYVEVYGGTAEQATRKASLLLAKPYIQEHITEAINRKYPDIAATCSDVLTEFITNPDHHPGIRLKAMEMLGKYFGWQAPTTVRNLNLKADLNKFKLPGEES